MTSAPNPSPPSRPPVWLVLAPAIAAISGVIVAKLLAPPGPNGFPLDDAWIHMVYARAVAFEGGLHYNPGHASSGCTSLLWPIVIAPVLRFAQSTGSVVAGVQTIGAAFHVVTSIASAWLADSVLGRGARWLSLMVGLTVALCPALIVSALSGMEVSLTAALLTSALVALFAYRPWLGGVLLALACWARPESAAVALALVLLPYAIERNHRDADWAFRPTKAIAVPVAAALGVSALRYVLAAGTLLPSSYYVKRDLSVLELPERLMTTLLDLLGRTPPFWGIVGWFALIGIPLAVRHRPHERARWLAPLVAALAYLLGNLVVAPPLDPGAFYHLRYVLPPLPLLVVCFAIGVHGIALHWASRSAIAQAAAGLICAIGVAVRFVPTTLRFHQDVRNVNDVQRAMGQWLGGVTRADDWIASSDAGAVRYFSGRRTIDVLGLNTPEIARPNADVGPVRLFALMPAWLKPTSSDGQFVLKRCRTDPYTLTSFRKMRTQLITACPGDGTSVRRVAFHGVRDFTIACRTISDSELDELARSPAPDTCKAAGAPWRVRSGESR